MTEALRTLAESLTPENLAALVSAAATLIVFSYLVKDNPLYRLALQAALGAAVGIGVFIAWRDVLRPKWWQPIQGAFAAGRPPADPFQLLEAVTAGRVACPKWWAAALAAFPESRPWTDALWLLALVPGSLWYFQLSKKWFWLSTLITGLFIGVSAGLAFKSQILLILPQIGASLKPIVPFAGPGGLTWASTLDCLNHLLFLVGMMTTLLYFFFSLRTESRFLRGSMRIGRLMIMATLGAMFASTVMTRMAYLLERLGFLCDKWLAPR
ncbi:MAG: hypothetical protein FJ291_28785 [Planctomycetes bacterium]|nr:hypothetical protein [Planctomycetota bacterium]